MIDLHSGVNQILIVQTAFIGDVILITPLIRAVKDLYPHACLDILTVPGAAGLLTNNPHIRDVLEFNKLYRLSFFSMLSTIKKRSYDLVISPHSSFTTHFLLWQSRIPVRIGYSRGFLNSFLMTHRVPHPKGIHKILKNLSLLKLISDREFPMQTELFPGLKEQNQAKIILQELGNQDKPLVAVAPGSIWRTKCWNQEYYQQLCYDLAKYGCRVLLSGGIADTEKCNTIVDFIKAQNVDLPVISVAGRSNLLTSAELIRQAKLLICNDSGALHIANAMQTKVFAFFGPTVQRIGYFPYREGDHVFEIDLDCRPCGSHGGNKCPLGHHNCMNLIKPDLVLVKALKTLFPEEITS